MSIPDRSIGRWIPVLLLVHLVAVLFAFNMRPGEAGELPAERSAVDDFIVIEVAQIIEGFQLLADLEVAGDGRFFAAQTSGEIRIAKSDGSILPQPFLDLSDQIILVGELGLSSIALHPQFESNGRLFVSYDTPDLKTYVVSYTESQADPDLADPDSAQLILSIDQPSAVHNGAGLVFGPDNYLYIGFGDGGPGNDPHGNAQNGQTLNGSILRIDVDGNTPYEIPADNPFVGDISVRDEIWAMGYRNPWRFSFDRLNGDLYVGDVGQDRWEEIDYEPAGNGGGKNYGWPCYEGFETHLTAGCAEKSAYVFPIHTFPNGVTSTAIIGGFVYRGNDSLPINGHYLFGEYRSGHIWSLVKSGDKWEISGGGKLPLGYLTSFEEGPNGELYAVDFGNIYSISARTVTLSHRAYLPIVVKH